MVACGEIGVDLPYVSTDRTIEAEVFIPEDVDSPETVIDWGDSGPLKLPVGQTVNSLPSPVIKSPNKNMGFKGWYLAPGGEAEDKVVFPFTVTEETKLYACFDEQYAIVQSIPDVNGYEVPWTPDEVRIFRNEELKAENLGTPEATGFDFLGWFTDPDMTEEAAFPIQITQSITLYAKFERTKVSVTYEYILNPASDDVIPSPMPENEKVEPDTMIQVPSDPVAAGYDFVAWYLDPDLTERMTGGVKAEGTELHLYAYFVEHEVVMTEGPEGEAIIPITYTADVSDPDDVHYVVSSIDDGEDLLYIINDINGYPVDIAYGAAVGMEFNGDADVTVRNIGSQAFENTEFINAEKLASENHSYSFTIVRDKNGNGGNLESGAFSNATFSKDASGGLITFSINQMTEKDDAVLGEVRDNALGMVVIGDTKANAKITMNLGTVIDTGLYSFFIGQESESKNINASIKIQKLKTGACDSETSFFEGFKGGAGNLSLTITEGEANSLDSAKFGEGAEISDECAVNIEIIGPEAAYQGSAYFTPSYIKNLAQSGELIIDECTSFIVNGTEILPLY